MVATAARQPRQSDGRRCGRATATALACVLGAAGCPRKQEEAPRIVEVRVVDKGARGADPVAGFHAETGALEARVVARLRGAGLMPVAIGEKPRLGVDYRVAVEVRVGQLREGGDPLLRAQVAARLSRASESRGERSTANEAVAERAMARGEAVDAAAARAHLERALDDVVDGLVRLARLRVGPAEDRIAALHVGDEEARREAALAIGDRKERGAVPVLVGLLKDPRPEVRDLALGTLIAIGDPAAARPIAEMARLNNALELPKIIEAMGTLGGDEARAYLEFILSAHDDPELRDMARSALARLNQREGQRESRPSASP